MKKRLIILVICLISLVCIINFIMQLNPFEGKTEYPLQLVDINDDSQYMLVKEFNGYEVVTDTELIKENASVFRFYNFGALYGTTPDGAIFLYKDGERIDCIWFDGMYTIMKEFGTLKFRKINKLQYMLLTGYEIVEQSDYYSILCKSQSEKPYYHFFIHGNDLESFDNVYYLDSSSSIDDLPKPQKFNDDILEFIEHYTTFAGDQTKHWYFRLSDCKLTNCYWNVMGVKDNLVLYSEKDGGHRKVIVHDMFDKSIDYKVISYN